MAAVANRYARAFADVVLDSKLDPTAVVQQVRSFVEMYEANEDLRRVWDSPAIPAEEKRKLLDAMVARMAGVTRPVRNFLAVLIDHGRISQLTHIAHQFEAELNQRLGRVEAEVFSARQLSDAERQALLTTVAQNTGRQVSAKYKIDPALIGGAVVKIGSTVYDGSVRGQLQRLKQELASE